jgi:hypothetical protein
VKAIRTLPWICHGGYARCTKELKEAPLGITRGIVLKRKTRRVVTHGRVFQQANLRGLEIFVRMRHHSEQREYGLDRKTSQQYIFAPPIGDCSITDSSNGKILPVSGRRGVRFPHRMIDTDARNEARVD